MKPSNVLQFLLVLVFLTMSCTGQNKETKGKTGDQSQTKEIRKFKEPKPAPVGSEGRDYVPGEILVKFRDGVDEKVIGAIQTELHLETIEVVPKLNVYRMRIQDGSSVEEVMKQLEGLKEVEYSEPNYIVTFQ